MLCSSFDAHAQKCHRLLTIKLVGGRKPQPHRTKTDWLLRFEPLWHKRRCWHSGDNSASPLQTSRGSGGLRSTNTSRWGKRRGRKKEGLFDQVIFELLFHITSPNHLQKYVARFLGSSWSEVGFEFMLEIYQRNVLWFLLLSNHRMNCTGVCLEADQDSVFLAISGLLSHQNLTDDYQIRPN